jgi:hypothetical protein
MTRSPARGILRQRGEAPYDAGHVLSGGRVVGFGILGIRPFGCRRVMKNSTDAPTSEGTVPLGQRLFDNVFLLLGAGLVIMLLLYTGWGLWEITSLPEGALP